MSEWHDIATAPRDRPIIVFCPDNTEDEQIMMAEWSENYDGSGCWRIHIDGHILHPTLWQPLPEPPK